MATMIYKEPPYKVEIATRYCETCNFPLAVEFRGEPDRVPEEIIYFCINKEKNCPMYHLAQ